MTATIETHVFENRGGLKELRLAHRELDMEIQQLDKRGHFDQISLKRLKKRKLALKDMIVRLESELIPNLNA